MTVMNINDVKAKRKEIQCKIKCCRNCLIIRNQVSNIFMLNEGISRKVSEYVCCKRCQRLLKAMDDESRELEYHCLRYVELTCYYFIKEHPFPNENVFENQIINDMFNCNGDKIKYTKRLYKLIKEFYECLPYAESKWCLITQEMNGRKHQKQALNCLSFDILSNILKFFEREENKAETKMIMLELADDFKHS